MRPSSAPAPPRATAGDRHRACRAGPAWPSPPRCPPRTRSRSCPRRETDDMTQQAEAVRYEADGPVVIITLDRPDVANAIDRPTAQALADAFRPFEADESLAVAVLTGANGKFCAGADLKAMREDPSRVSRVAPDGDGPVGPTRMLLGKPVIAAVEG